MAGPERAVVPPLLLCRPILEGNRLQNNQIQEDESFSVLQEQVWLIFNLYEIRFNKRTVLGQSEHSELCESFKLNVVKDH